VIEEKGTEEEEKKPVLRAPIISTPSLVRRYGM
jgi:hypothetical protein